MAEEKKAKKVITLEDIRYDESNKGMAILSMFPFFILNIIIYFIEKEDDFVRYNAVQFGILSAIFSVVWVFTWIPLILFIVAVIKLQSKERFDIPLISDLAIKIMNAA